MNKDGFEVFPAEWIEQHQLVLEDALELHRQNKRVNDVFLRQPAWDVVHHTMQRINTDMVLYGDVVLFVRSVDSEFTGFIGPHRDLPECGPDSFIEKDIPGSIVCWVALNDATLLNSCLYVLPKDHDPSYYGPGLDLNIPPNKMDQIRALPVQAGSIILIGHRLIHWGSRPIQGTRVTLSFTLVHPEVIAPKILREPVTFEERQCFLAAFYLWYFDHNPFDINTLNVMLSHYRLAKDEILTPDYRHQMVYHIQHLKFASKSHKPPM